MSQSMKFDCIRNICRSNKLMCDLFVYLFVCIYNFCSETVESRSTSPQIFSAPVSSQSQTTNPLTSLATPAVSIGSLQSQVNCTPYNSFQPQITSFLHQFEQFANNKTVCILLKFMICAQ